MSLQRRNPLGESRFKPVQHGIIPWSKFPAQCKVLGIACEEMFIESLQLWCQVTGCIDPYLIGFDISPYPGHSLAVLPYHPLNRASLGQLRPDRYLRQILKYERYSLFRVKNRKTPYSCGQPSWFKIHGTLFSVINFA